MASPWRGVAVAGVGQGPCRAAEEEDATMMMVEEAVGEEAWGWRQLGRVAGGEVVAYGETCERRCLPKEHQMAGGLQRGTEAVQHLKDQVEGRVVAGEGASNDATGLLVGTINGVPQAEYVLQEAASAYLGEASSREAPSCLAFEVCSLNEKTQVEPLHRMPKWRHGPRLRIKWCTTIGKARRHPESRRRRHSREPWEPHSGHWKWKTREARGRKAQIFVSSQALSITIFIVIVIFVFMNRSSSR